MKRNKISSNIELTSGEVISLILDGAIPCLILHPHEDIVDYIEDIVKPIKYSLLKKGFYVKTFDHHEIDAEMVEKSSEESSFTIILLDGLNANILYSYGFFKGKEKNIFPIFNTQGEEDGDVKTFSDSSNIISIDISEKDPNYISLQINNILDSYLSENSHEIINDLVVDNLLISNINDSNLIKQVSNLSKEIIEYYLGLSEPTIDNVNEIYETIINIEKNNQVNFPPYIYSLLPAVYLSLFETIVINPLELNKCINNIKQLFEDIFNSVSEKEQIVIKRRFADAHTLISAFDNKIDNCEAAVYALKEVVEKGVKEDSSLYRTKVFNNLGVNLLAIEDVKGGLGYLNEAIEYFQNSLTDFLQKAFPLEYGLYQKNLGLAYCKKAELLNSKKEFENSLNSFTRYSETYSEISFPKEYFDAKLHIANIHREIGYLDLNVENFIKSFEFYDEALSYYTLDKFPKVFARIQNELGKCYTLKAQVEYSESSLDEAKSCFEKSLKVFSLNEYPIFYALTKSNIADLITVDADKKGYDNLDEVIEHYEEALTFLRYSENPKLYAGIQKKLGDIYRRLSVDNNDQELCIWATESYEEALRVYNHENFPVDYAKTKIGLSKTYEVLSEIEDDITYIEKAIESYNDSLSILNKSEFPLQYAEIQTNLGNSYSSLANVKNQGDNSSKAVEAYNIALEFINPNDFPTDFAKTKNNLGVAYRASGVLEKDVEKLENAIECFNDCINILEGKGSDEEAGMIKNNIGDTCYAIYSINREPDLLFKSIESYNDSKTTYNKESFPDDFALIERKIGKSYLELSRYKDYENYSEAAIQSFTNSLEYFTREESSEENGLINKYIGDLYSNVTESKADTETINLSIEAYKNSMEFYHSSNSPEYYSDIANSIGNQYKKLSEFENKATNIQNAIEYYRKALEIIDPEQQSYMFAVVGNNVGTTYGILAEVSEEDDYSQKAVESFQNSISNLNKEQHPLVYASISSNLGIALIQTSNSVNNNNCQLAINSFNEALDILDPLEQSDDFLVTSNNLAETYTLIAGNDGNAENCNKAIETITKALEYCDEDKSPGIYSILNNSLGNAYQELSNFDKKIENNGTAIKYYDNSLSHLGDNSYFSSTVNQNLGVAYFNLSGEIDGYENCLKSSEYFKNSMELFKSEPRNIQCGVVKNCYAYSMETMSRLDDSSNYKSEAVNAYNCSLRYYNKDERPSQYASIKFNLAKLNYELGLEEKDFQKIVETIEDFKNVLELYNTVDNPYEYGTVCYFIARATISQENTEIDKSQLLQAAEYTEKSLDVFDSDNFPYHNACNNLILAETSVGLGELENNTDSFIKGITYYGKAILFFDTDNYPEENEQIRSAIADTYTILESMDNFENDPKQMVEYFNNLSQTFTYNEFPAQFAGTQKKLGDSYLRIFESDRNVADIQNAVLAYNKSLNALRDKADSEDVAEINYSLGKCYQALAGDNNNLNNLEQTIESFNKALEYFEENTNQEKITEISSYLANLYVDLSDASKIEGDYENALDQILKANDLFNNDSDKDLLAAVSVKTGEIYSYLGNENESQDYLQKAVNSFDHSIKYYDENMRTDESANLLENIGDIYSKIYELDQNISSLLNSKDFYQKSFELTTNNNDELAVSSINEKLGNAFQTLGIIERESHNSENALSHFEKSLNYIDAENFPDRYSVIQKQISSCYIEEASRNEESNPAEALKLFLKALDNIDEYDVSFENAKIYRSLGKLFKDYGPDEDVKSNLNHSINFYKKSLDYFTIENEKDFYVQINVIIADSYKDLQGENNLEEAIKHYDEALKCLNPDENSKQILNIETSKISIFQQIASFYSDNGDYQSSIQIYNKLFDLIDTESQVGLFAEINCRMGLALYNEAIKADEIEQYKNCIIFLEKANDHYTLNDNPIEYTELNIALAGIYGKLSEEEANSEYELKSIEYLSNCLNVYDKETQKEKYTEVLKTYIESTLNTARSYFKNNEYLKCIEFINKLDESLFDEDLRIEIAKLNLLNARSYEKLADLEDSEQKEYIQNSIKSFSDVAEILNREEYHEESVDINLSLALLYEKLYKFNHEKNELENSISFYKNSINLDKSELPEKTAFNEKKIAENHLKLSLQDDTGIGNIKDSFKFFINCLSYYSSKDFPEEYGEVLNSFDLMQNRLIEIKDIDSEISIEILKQILPYLSNDEYKDSNAKINKELGQLIEIEADRSGSNTGYIDAASYYDNYLGIIAGEKKHSEFYFINFKLGELYSKFEIDENTSDSITKAINHLRISREYFNNEGLVQELKTVNEHLVSLYERLITLYEEQGSTKLSLEVAKDSLSIFSKETNPDDYAKFSYFAGLNYLRVALDENNKENYFNALSFLEESHSVFNDSKYGVFFGQVTRSLGSVYHELYKLEDQDDYLIKSRDSYIESLMFYTLDNFKSQNTEIEKSIREINLLLADSSNIDDDPETRINSYIEARKDYGPDNDAGKYTELSLKLAEIYKDLYTETMENGNSLKSIEYYYDALNANTAEEKVEIQSRVFEGLNELFSVLIKGLDESSNDKILPIINKVLEPGPVADQLEKYAEQNEQLGDKLLKLNSSGSSEDYIRSSIECYSIANEYYNKCSRLDRVAKVNIKLADSCNLISEITDFSGNLSSAVSYYNSALNYYINTNDQERVEIISNKIVTNYVNLGDYEAGRGNIDLAEKMYRNVFEIEAYKIPESEIYADINIKLYEIFHKKYVETEDDNVLLKSTEYLNKSLIFYNEKDFPEKYIELNDKIESTSKEKIIIHESDDLETRIKKLEEISEHSDFDEKSVEFYDLQKNLANSYYLLGKEIKNFEYLSKCIELFKNILPLIPENNKTVEATEIYQNLSDSYRLIAKGTDKDLINQSLNYAINSWDLYNQLGENDAVKIVKQKIFEDLSLYIYLEAISGNTSKSIEYLTEFFNTHQNKISNEEKTSLKYEFLLELRKLASIENINLIENYIYKFKETTNNTSLSHYADETDKYLVEAYFTLGIRHNQSGDFTNAKSLLSKASELTKTVKDFPHATEINYQLGLLHKGKWELNNDKEQIAESINFFTHALDGADNEKKIEIKNILKDLQNAYDSQDVDHPVEIELDEEFVGESEGGSKDFGSVEDPVTELNKGAFEIQSIDDEIVSKDHDDAELPERNIDDVPSSDQLNKIKILEKTFSSIDLDDNPTEYGNVSIELGSSYHKLANIENSSKYFGLAINYFRNALKVFTESTDKQKYAEINRYIADTYNDLTRLSNDLRQYKDMINCYTRSLAYFTFDKFPKENGEINYKLGKSNYYLAENSGDPKSYEIAIVNFNDALKYFNKEKAQNEFAEIHKDLGVSYGIMAELTADTELHKKAINSYQNALEIFADTDNYKEKAIINKYLGISYNAQVDSDEDPENLKKAIQNYNDSLTFYTQEEYLSDYGLVNKNMGFLYIKLSEYESKSENIMNAAKSFEESLIYYNLEQSPNDFADLNNRLATLYNSLFDQDEDIKHCFKSISYYEEVLKVYNINDNPMEFAAVNNNLGISYRALAEYDSKAENCIKAITSYSNSLNVYKLKDFPLQYGSTQNNLGSAYRTLAEEKDKAENCKNAVKAYKEALKVRSIQQMPVQFAATQNNLGVAYRTLSDVENKARNCKRAIEAYEAALIVYTLDQFPIQYATTKNNIAGAFTTLAETEEARTNGENAINYYKEAQQVFSNDEYPEYFEMIEDSINYVKTLVDA